MQRFFDHVKAKCLTGLFVLIPVGITIFILRFLFNVADGILGPSLARLASLVIHRDLYIPGLGMLTGLVVIYLTGLFVSNLVGHALLKRWELLVVRIPLVKSIYTASRQLTDIFREGKGAYRRAVFVEWPRPGVKAVGFVTGEVVGPEGTRVVVYIPTMPNPTSGFALFFREDEVTDAGMTVEEAVKFVVSGGMVIT